MEVHQAGVSSAWETPAHVPAAQQPTTNRKTIMIELHLHESLASESFLVSGVLREADRTGHPAGCCTPNAPTLQCEGAWWRPAARGVGALGCSWAG